MNISKMRNIFKAAKEILKEMVRTSQEEAEFHKNEELVAAACVNDLNAVKECLARGANLNYVSSSKGNITALMGAAMQGYNGMVQLLIDKGVDVNHANEEGRTALMDAAAFGHDAVVSTLIRNRANVNHATQEEKRTALMEAAEHGRKGVVKILLDNGADVSARDSQGRTALVLAVGCGHWDVEKAIKGSAPRKGSVSGQDRNKKYMRCFRMMGPVDGHVPFLRERGERRLSCIND